MNRIDKLFSEKKKDVLAVYFTAGFPNGENACDVTAKLADAGVDLVEIGMPFSDPLADGPVIQESSMIALRNGMNIPRLFDELKDLRSKTAVPVVLMGYLNPVLQFGVERFVQSCVRCGVDGVILPDLPVEEFAVHEKLFSEKGIHVVFLIAPSLPEDRIKMIAGKSRGFVYVVSGSSTTGASGEFDSSQLKKLESTLNTIEGIPAMVGFGIHDRKSFEAATKNAAGGIVGSAFIRELKDNNMDDAIEKLVKRIKPELYDHSIV